MNSLQSKLTVTGLAIFSWAFLTIFVSPASADVVETTGENEALLKSTPIVTSEGNQYYVEPQKVEWGELYASDSKTGQNTEPVRSAAMQSWEPVSYINLSWSVQAAMQVQYQNQFTPTTISNSSSAESTQNLFQPPTSAQTLAANNILESATSSPLSLSMMLYTYGPTPPPPPVAYNPPSVSAPPTYLTFTTPALDPLSTPEPSTIGLVLAGAGLIFIVRRRRLHPRQ